MKTKSAKQTKSARVVPTSEGRMIEVMEGELRAPSPEPTPAKKTTKPRKPRKKAESDHNKSKGAWKRPDLKEDHPVHKKSREIPGYREWYRERMRQIQQFFNKPGGPVRRRRGVPDGMRREEAEKLWAEARRKAKIDMENIKKVMPDLNESAAEALETTLTIMRSPMNQDMQLKAARQVLEWTMAKPVNKTEMTVNAAEAWLAQIAEEANEK